MEKEIWLEKESVGRAVFSQDGGHLEIEAVCPYKDGIWRLYMTENEKYHNLGVMIPESGKLMLKRRVSLPALGLRPERACLRLMPGSQTPKPEEEEDGAPERDPTPEEAETEESRPEACESPPAGITDRWCACPAPAELTDDELMRDLLAPVSGALYRYRGGGVELAVPAQEAQAVSAVLCLTRAEKIRDGEYFVISLDGSGRPAPAMPPSRY